MNDIEVIQCIEERDDKLFKNVKDLIDGYTSSVTTLVTTENQNIKHSIDALTERVKRQNGSVRELNEWRAGLEGMEKAKDSVVKTKAENRADIQKRLQLIATVIMALGLCITGYFSFFGSQQSKINNKKIESLGDPVITNSRGELLPLPPGASIKMWPKDFSGDNDTLTK